MKSDKNNKTPNSSDYSATGKGLGAWRDGQGSTLADTGRAYMAQMAKNLESASRTNMQDIEAVMNELREKFKVGEITEEEWRQQTEALGRNELVQNALANLHDGKHEYPDIVTEVGTPITEFAAKINPQIASRSDTTNPFKWAQVLLYVGILVFPNEGGRSVKPNKEEGTNAYVVYDEKTRKYIVNNVDKVTLESFYASYVFFKRSHRNANNIVKRNKKEFETWSTSELKLKLPPFKLEAFKFVTKVNQVLDRSNDKVGKIDGKTTFQHFLDTMEQAYGTRDAYARILYDAYDEYYKAERIMKQEEKTKGKEIAPTTNLYITAKVKQDYAKIMWRNTTQIAELGTHLPAEKKSSASSAAFSLLPDDK